MSIAPRAMSASAPPRLTPNGRWWEKQSPPTLRQPLPQLPLFLTPAQQPSRPQPRAPPTSSSPTIPLWVRSPPELGTAPQSALNTAARGRTSPPHPVSSISTPARPLPSPPPPSVFSPPMLPKEPTCIGQAEESTPLSPAKTPTLSPKDRP